MKKGVLAEINNLTLGNETVIKSQKGANLSVASTVPDYANFKQGSMMNSTEAVTPDVVRISSRTPGYMTPTQSMQNRVFKTPTTPASRSRMGTKAKTTKLTAMKSGRALPFLF